MPTRIFIPSRSAIAYSLALLAEAVLFYRQVLFYPGYLFPWDFRAVHLPLATFVAASFRRGELPLWDPYTYCGNPIYANIQTALFYPPILASTLAGAWFGTDLLPRLLAITVVMQVFFAGLCTFTLLRRIGVQPAAAWIGATVYQLGCFFASQAEHMGAMHGASWLPLAWLCVLELRSSLRWTWLALLSLALSMSVLAGLPQVAVAVFGSVLSLSLLLPAFRLARWTLPVHAALAGIWALLISAIQVFPTAELTRNSVAKYRAEWLNTGGGIQPGALLSLVVPNYWHVFDLSKFHGPSDLTFLYLYSSLLGLLLAFAAIAWRPNRWARLFALLFAAATIWMLGDSTPIGRAIFTALPVSIRIGLHPEFTLCVFSLALAVLAGCGANVFLGAKLQVLAGILIASDLLLVSSGRPMNTSSRAIEPGITHDSIDGNSTFATRLRGLADATVPQSRFDMAPSISYVWSSSAPLLEIPTANGCDPLAPERIIQVRLSFAPGAQWGTCYQVVNATSPVLGLINDRYLVSRDRIAGMPLLAESGGYKIFEHPHTMMRFFLLNRATRVDNISQAAQALNAPDFKPAESAIVEAPQDRFKPLPFSPAPGRVEVLSYRFSAIILRTDSPAPALLVATDTWYPGWKATLDGIEAPIYLTDVAFRGIRIPSGKHTVEMRFVPHILYRSAVLSAAALLAILGVINRRPARREPSPATLQLPV